MSRLQCDVRTVMQFWRHHNVQSFVLDAIMILKVQQLFTMNTTSVNLATKLLHKAGSVRCAGCLVFSCQP